MNTVLKHAFVIAAVLASTAGRGRAGLIDTTAAWDGTESVSPFGEPAFATFGQTFTVVGPEVQLDTFSFWIDDALTSFNPDSVEFAAYVMQWDNTLLHAVGPALYQSSMQTTTNNGGLNGMEMFTFDTGGTVLLAGQKYVAFVSATDFFDGVNGVSSVGETPNTYAGGDAVWSDNGNNFSPLTNVPWSYSDVRDLAFQATFSTPVAAAPAVAEPPSLALLGLGGLGLLLYRRRRGNGRSFDLSRCGKC